MIITPPSPLPGTSTLLCGRVTIERSLVDNENALLRLWQTYTRLWVAIVVIKRSSDQQQVSLNVDGYMPYSTNLTDVLSTNTYTISTNGVVGKYCCTANSMLFLSHQDLSPGHPIQ
jgi:hypothetical protein